MFQKISQYNHNIIICEFKLDYEIYCIVLY